MSDIPRHLLPASLLTIAEYCGDAVMWKVWEHWGGGHLHVPRRYHPEHPVSQALGPELAPRFIAAFGDELLFIPRASSARLHVRNSLIRARRAEGWTLFRLAREFDMTERHIVTICQAAAPGVNNDLFETLPGDPS